MRKIFIAILLCLYASTSYAGTVTVDSLVSADDVTMEWLNGFKNTVIDAINSFPGDNVQSGTITTTALDNNANPEYRWGESFNNYVYTGLLAPTATGLTTTTTAGTAYIKETTTLKMKRVVKDATANTYTASKDTYVDLSSSGTFTYSEVANGAATPTTTTNSIRLFKVVTNATDVTSVTDLRVLGIQLSTHEDFYVSGFGINSADSETVTFDAGVIYNGATRVVKTSRVALIESTSGDWWDGVIDSYAGGAGWNYIGIDSVGNIKFIGANPPNYSDTDGNTTGRLIYWKDTSNAYWRVIAGLRINTSNKVANSCWQVGNRVYIDSNDTVLSGGTQTSYTDVDCSSFIPAISQEGLFYYQTAYTAGNTCNAYMRPDDTTWDYLAMTYGSDSANYGVQQSVFQMPTDSTQTIEYKVAGTGATLTIKVKGYLVER